jgi:hypothetical protein
MPAIEITEQQNPSTFASSWLINLTPNKNKFGSTEGGREEYEHNFQVHVRRLMRDLASGSPEFFNIAPIDSRAVVQFAFERGNTRHRNTLHCHALVSAVHQSKGARLNYNAIRQRMCGNTQSCVWVHVRLMRNIHGLQHALRYIGKNQPRSQ